MQIIWLLQFSTGSYDEFYNHTLKAFKKQSVAIKELIKMEKINLKFETDKDKIYRDKKDQLLNHMEATEKHERLEIEISKLISKRYNKVVDIQGSFTLGLKEIELE